MNQRTFAKRILGSRGRLPRPDHGVSAVRTQPAEGGCGVIGLACDEPIAGRHLLRSLEQMRNRGNGKGGGVAAAGLIPEELGVTQRVLERDYLVSIAYLDPSAREEVERGLLEQRYTIDHVREPSTRDDDALRDRMDTEPPTVVQYFVRPRQDAVSRFARDNDLEAAPSREVEDEFVYQTSYELNRAFYSATGEARAFVLSHGKDLIVLKAVAYADDIFRWYQLEDLHAHVWIGHHRYPTKGKVWHPGGAHPFIGLHEALVHNGDFANYHGVREYLAQRNIHPLFLTDTEVSVLVFDLLHRTYGYPLEHVVEALAPTTERDFVQLKPDKQAVYRAIQETHMQGSPDGPWFFLIAQSLPARNAAGPVHRLLGITDTSMLRPQVFALQDAGDQAPRLGLAASEKQAIDAALASLAEEDERFWGRADRYWNARGGSHTDGGAFQFTVKPDGDGRRLVCTDKFGREITIDTADRPLGAGGGRGSGSSPIELDVSADADDVAQRVAAAAPAWSAEAVDGFLDDLLETAEERGAQGLACAWRVLARLIDQRYPTAPHRRSSLLSRWDQGLKRLTRLAREAPRAGVAFHDARSPLPEPEGPDARVLVDATGFPQEGDGSLARALIDLVQQGFEHLIVTGCHGHRFIGTGLGSGTQGVRIDVHGSPGDYLASGLDGADVHVHATGQDQLAQIMKDGRLVLHGDVGQAFMYGAEGGKAFVLGNAAGRPLINAVGAPRVVINATALDYLGESFMAGDPLDGGGFVLVNGITFEDGEVRSLETPYPGGNLFSLASGGACYVRDPHRRLGEDQLNGGVFSPITPSDWDVMAPMLEENERLFGVPVDRLLTVDGSQRAPTEVYRKVEPGEIKALQAEEAWVTDAS